MEGNFLKKDKKNAAKRRGRKLFIKNYEGNSQKTKKGALKKRRRKVFIKK